MNVRRTIGLFSWLVAVGGCVDQRVQPLAAAVPPKAPEAVASPTPNASPAAQPSVSIPRVEEAGSNSPIRVIERYTAELREMVGLNERKQKGIKDEEKERKVQAKVREFFDFPTLARLSLGPKWKRITPTQQREYSTLFVELVENSYIRRSRDLVGNYDLSFTKEEISGHRAKVTCRVARKDADIDILYELHRKDGNWMIFNIVLDNVDLIQNYESQFNQIIQQRGWDRLIRLMRAKLDGGDEDEAAL